MRTNTGASLKSKSISSASKCFSLQQTHACALTSVGHENKETVCGAEDVDGHNTCKLLMHFEVAFVVEINAVQFDRIL